MQPRSRLDEGIIRLATQPSIVRGLTESSVASLAFADKLRGKAALITKGSYLGQVVEIDHIVPVARHPQFANELANLQLMPGMQNRAK